MTLRPPPLTRGYSRARHLRVGQHVECHGSIGTVVATRIDQGQHRRPGEWVTLTIAPDRGGVLSWYVRADDTVRLT